MDTVLQKLAFRLEIFPWSCLLSEEALQLRVATPWQEVCVGVLSLCAVENAAAWAVAPTAATSRGSGGTRRTEEGCSSEYTVADGVGKGGTVWTAEE